MTTHIDIYRLYCRFRKEVYKGQGMDDDKASRKANIDAVRDTSLIYHNHHYGRGESVAKELQWLYITPHAPDDRRDLMNKIDWMVYSLKE